MSTSASKKEPFFPRTLSGVTSLLHSPPIVSNIILYFFEEMEFMAVKIYFLSIY